MPSTVCSLWNLCKRISSQKLIQNCFSFEIFSNLEKTFLLLQVAKKKTLSAISRLEIALDIMCMLITYDIIPLLCHFTI